MLDLLNTPYQHLQKNIHDMVKRGRQRQANQSRTYFGDVDEIDNDILRGALDQFDEKGRNIYAHIAIGGFWSEQQKM